MSEFKIGQTVETSTQQRGIVKYVGPIHVAEGTWLGIDLQAPEGKNDGSVRGERYFDCPPGFGLFVKEANVVRIVAQPAPRPVATPKRTVTPSAAPKRAITPTTVPKRAITPSTATKAAPKPKPMAPPTTRPRPSSVSAPKPAPRTSIVAKRQSMAPPAAPRTGTRSPVRKASLAGSTTSESSTRPSQTGTRASLGGSTASSTVRSSKDSNVETLQTKIRHLEKQHTDDQERFKELSQAKEERDRFHGIIQKLQSKCQTFHQETTDLKAQAQELQSNHDRLAKAQEEHEADFEIATLDKEMAEERAEQAESELEILREKLEERDMELDVLRSEAELFTADMSAEEREQAGYYRLQHENERLRQALITLKEMTNEQEQDLKARIRELEQDANQVEPLQQENTTLQEQIATHNAIIEHLQAQVDASADFEDMSNELTSKNQELEDKIADQDIIIRDLEALKDLNDELEVQHMEQEEELRVELETRESELAEQTQRNQEQSAVIVDNEDLITKFRDLVLDLQTKMADAESSKTMTEAQVKDTTGRFNEVMDLNRQLRAASVNATKRDIIAELSTLKAEEAIEELAILSETGSNDFSKSEPLRAYFTSKRIASKARFLTQALQTLDRQMSNGGRLEDAVARLNGQEAMRHVGVIGRGGNRLFSAISVSSLSDFSTFGPAYHDLITVEAALDNGLNSLKVDEVNYVDLAGSFGRSAKIQDAILSSHQTALAALPEEETLSRTRSIEWSLGQVAFTLDIIASSLQKAGDDVRESCQSIIDRLKTPSEATKTAVAAAEKVVRTLMTLRNDSMYPQLPNSPERIIELDDNLARVSESIATFGREIVEEVTKHASQGDDASEESLLSMKQKLSSLDLKIEQEFTSVGIGFLAPELRQWNEHASVLMNNIEIQHGPSPWTQKAQEVKAAKSKNEEAALQLETLKAELQTTRLRIYEREESIKTKELEIEHLQAKHREAISKVEEFSKLQSENTTAHNEIMRLQKEARAQIQKIEALQEFASRADRSEDLAPVSNDISTPVVLESTENHTISRNVPASLMSLLDALQTENNWLRQRGHMSMLERNIRDLSFEMPRSQTWQHPLDGELLLDEEWLSDDEDDDEHQENTHTAPTTKHAHTPSFESQSTRYASHRPKRTPLSLGAVQTGWKPRMQSHRGEWDVLEDYYGRDLMLDEGGLWGDDMGMGV